MIEKKIILSKLYKEAKQAHNDNKKSLSRELFQKHFINFEEKKIGKALCDYLIKNKISSSESIIKQKIDELSELTNGKLNYEFSNLIINYLKNYKTKGYNCHNLNFNFKCVFFGGIGFSGSSAIFDYYNTYTDLPGTRSQHFLVRRIIDIVLKSNDYIEVFDNFLIFLFRDLMGLYSYTSPSSYRLVVQGNQIYNYNSFSNFNKVFKDIALYIFSRNYFKDDVSKKIDILLFNIFKLLKNDDTSTFLAFGFLDLPHYHLIQYLKNHKFIFSLRDPRDIYLDAQSRNLNFFNDINIFIKNYSQKFGIYNNIKKNIDSNIKIIYFEDFISNKSSRDELSNFLDITINENLKKKKKIKYSFDLDESKKNIKLYINNISETKNIHKIENELSFFLNDTN